MAVELWLRRVPLLAPPDRTLEAKRLAVDGLYVHQQIVAHTESSVTFLALENERNQQHVIGELRERERLPNPLCHTPDPQKPYKNVASNRSNCWLLHIAECKQAS